MRLILFFLLSISSIVEARMYQWVEPGVDTTQLSGKPPAWYRSATGGPRVFVFENGRLIDDTAVEVSEEVRQRMRRRAFILAEEDREKAKEKIVRANELKQSFAKEESKQEETVTDNEVEDNSLELLTDSLFPQEEKNEQNDDEAKMEELKKVIADWEAAQSENARKALE